MAPPNTFDGYYGSYGTAAEPRPPGVFGMTSNGGPMAGAAQAVLPMIAELLRNQFGGSVFTFGSDMNATSAKAAQQYLLDMQRAREFGAQADQAQTTQLMSGVARMLGHRMDDPEIQRAIGRLSGDVTQMLPVLAGMFPDQVDRWMPRGSMAVAASSFVRAGRFVVDPLTGAPVSTDPEYASRVLKPLLAQDPGVTSGLGAGRLGGIYEQLVGRGLIDSGGELKRLVDSGSMTGDAARDVQADRVRARLTEYSKAIGAINDIFAEAGRPDAPMAELFSGLQKLTAGGIGGQTPDQLAKTARMAQSIAQTTGMGLEGQGALTAQLAAGLRAGGQTMVPAAYMSAYTAVLGRAYANRGLVFSGPEGATIDDVVARRGALEVAGGTSDYADLVSAVLAMGAAADDGTGIRALATGIRDKKTIIALPDGSSVDVRALTPDRINAIAAGSGLGVGALQNQLLAKNQLEGAYKANPEAVNTAIRVMQEDAARNYFLTMASTGPLAGKDLGELYSRLLGASADGRLLDDASVIRSATDGLGYSSEERSYLRTMFGGRMGGRHAFNLTNPVVREDAERDLAYNRERALLAERMAGVARGGFGRQILGAIGGYDGTLGSMLKAFGLVTEDDFKSAGAGLSSRVTDLYKIAFPGTSAAADAAKAILGGVGGGGAGLGGDVLGGVGEELRRTAVGRGGWGVPGDAPSEAASMLLKGAEKIGLGVLGGGPRGVSTTDVKIDVARVVFEGGGMSITGGGAIRGSS